LVALFPPFTAHTIQIVGITYTCDDFGGEMLAETDETTELRWFDINELPENISPPDKKAFEAFAKQYQ